MEHNRCSTTLMLRTTWFKGTAMDMEGLTRSVIMAFLQVSAQASLPNKICMQTPACSTSEPPLTALPSQTLSWVSTSTKSSTTPTRSHPSDKCKKQIASRSLMRTASIRIHNLWPVQTSQFIISIQIYSELEVKLQLKESRKIYFQPKSRFQRTNQAQTALKSHQETPVVNPHQTATQRAHRYTRLATISRCQISLSSPTISSTKTAYSKAQATKACMICLHLTRSPCTPSTHSFRDWSATTSCSTSCLSTAATTTVTKAAVIRLVAPSNALVAFSTDSQHLIFRTTVEEDPEPIQT